MNLRDWEDALRRLPRNLGPHHQSGVNNSTASTTRDTYCEYSRYTVDAPHSTMGVNVGWKELTPPSHNLYSRKSEVEDPDGEPLEVDEVDPELARKRKELRQIEEQIMCKKVAIALKTVESVVNKTPSAGFSCNEQSATCEAATLRDRVNVILRQRHSLSFVTKSAQERMKSSSLSEGVVLLEDHPLKLRVKALMRQRCRDPCALPTNSKVHDVTQLPPSQSVTSPAQEESNANKGFQRFLSMLNKGVDIDLLNRIVNDDSEDLPLGEDLLNIQSLVLKSKSHLPCQQSDSGGHSQTKRGERKTDPLSHVQSHNESLSLPDEDEKKNDRGHRCFGSSSRSKSPPAVKKKKKEVNPKVDEQNEQLQNILKTLGLSLEVDEMNKLADRTQERLYGKKHEGGQRSDSREEQDSQPRGSHRHYSKSSSSSSSSSSSCSRSTSRSVSPSSSHHPRFHRSHSSNSRERGRASERRHSRDRNRDVVTSQDGSQDGNEAQRHVDKETSSFQHPYPPNQSYPFPHPPAFPAFSDYSLAQYPQHTAYHTYPQDAVPSPFHPSWYPYPQNTSHHFPGPVMAPNTVYPHDHPFEDINFHMNPNSWPGQIGSSSGRRRRKRTKKEIMRYRSWLAMKTTDQRKLSAKQNNISVKRLEAPQDKTEDPEAEQSEEGTRQPTEEEIKANLRKKLEAFNQMVKQKVTEPANS